MPDNYGINQANRESNPIYNQLFEQYFSQYGNADRARGAALNAQDYYSSQPSAMGSIKDITYDPGKEGDYLSQLAYGQNPYMQQIRQNLYNQIGSQRRVANEETAQRLAQTGLSRSGVGASAYMQNNVASQNALAQGEAQIGQNEMQLRNQAIGQLLGIKQFQAGLEGQNQSARLQALGLDRSYINDIMGNAERQREFNSQINAQKEAQDNQLWSSLGGSLGTLAGNFLLPGIGGWLGGKAGGIANAGKGIGKAGKP